MKSLQTHAHATKMTGSRKADSDRHVQCEDRGTDMHPIAMKSNQYLFPAVLPVVETGALPSFAALAAPSSTGRYWRTLRHLRLSQLLYLGLHRTLGRNDI